MPTLLERCCYNAQSRWVLGTFVALQALRWLTCLPAYPLPTQTPRPLPHPLSPLPDHAIAGPEHIVVADVAAGCVVVTLSQSHSLQVLVPVQSPSGSSSGRRHSGSGSAEPATSAAEAVEAYGGAHTAGSSRPASNAGRSSAPFAPGAPWAPADTGATPGVPPGRASAPGPGVGAAAQHAPGPGSRKRARQGCRLELAGVVPLSEEVSCLQVRG